MIKHKKQLILKSFKLILILAISALLYSFYLNCIKNYSKTFSEIGNPMVSNVLDFYKENKRYPNLEESEVLMEKAGCSKIKQRKYKELKNIKGEIYERRAAYDCDFKSRTYGYGINIGDLTVDSDAEAYEFGFHKGKTRCNGNFFSTKIGGYFGCQQDSCMNASR